MDAVEQPQVTVTCQASLPEYGALVSWQFWHQPGLLLRYIFLGCYFFATIVASWAAANLVWGQGRTWLAWLLAGVVFWSAAYVYGYAYSLLSRPHSMWESGADTPTTLTISDQGLAYTKDDMSVRLGWSHYFGYAQLPSLLVLVARADCFIVPRSTVNPDDFDRVLEVVMRHLRPTTRSRFDA